MDAPDHSSAPGPPRIVIVGAGISGVALASTLTGAPAEVILLEQVIPPGRRRVFSGVVSSEDLAALALSPDDIDASPIGRISHVNLATSELDRDLVASDWWAAEHGILVDAAIAKLRSNAVTVVPNATVTGFIWEHGSVAGVRCGDTGQTFAADLVVLADESDPRVPEQIGLRPDWMPTELMHLCKVRYPASPDTIRQRLGDSRDAYRVVAFLQRTSWDCPGYGLVIPGRDAITLCVAMSLEDEMVSARHIREYLDEVQRFPAIQHVIEGLPETNFFTEVVPTGGFDARHRFHANRVLVVNDLVGVTNPLDRDGLSANLAACAAAAVTIRKAIETGDFSDRMLAGYSKRITDDVVGPVNAARRTDKSLRTIPPWQWASKPDLVPRLQEVTFGGKSATLPQDNDSGMWKRVRRFGRLPGVRKHAPGEYDE